MNASQFQFKVYFLGHIQANSIEEAMGLASLIETLLLEE